MAQDYAKAGKWYRRAAAQGLAEAQFGLGSMCMRGEGFAQNYLEAHKWFNIAASRGGKKASRSAKARDAVAQKITKEQVVEAQRMATAWKPKEREAG